MTTIKAEEFTDDKRVTLSELHPQTRSKLEQAGI